MHNLTQQACVRHRRPSKVLHVRSSFSQAYGVVWKAIEKRTRQVLALKKCFDAFRNATDAQRTFREIMYLQALAGHDNLIRLQHVVKAENGRDIYLTFDHMGEDNANYSLPILESASASVFSCHTRWARTYTRTFVRVTG